LTFIEKGREKISDMYKNYNDAVKIIATKDLEELKYKKVYFKEFLTYLKITMIAKKKNVEEEITEIKTRQAINIHTVLYDVSWDYLFYY
jgi:hypothetical protein